MPVHDPFGLTPQYVHRRTSRTSRGIYDLIEPRPTPNPDAALEYVLFGDVWGSATMFADIERVQSPRPVLSTKLVERDGRELVELFWAKLGDAVARSVGDSTDILVAISGGLDAAALAAACVERFGADSVRAATVGAPGSDESRAAQASADALGIALIVVEEDHRVVDWPAHSLWPVLPRTATERAWDELTADATVVWGIGGDSLQRGDRGHYPERLRRGQWLLAAADVARSVVLHGCKPALGLRHALSRPNSLALPGWLRSELEADARAIAERRVASSVFRRGVDEMFAPSWRAFFEWMAPQHNDPPTEHRFPFFDLQLIEFMASVPTAPWCVDKNLLRASLRGRIPDPVRLRAKSPSSEPARISWDNGLADELNAWLAESEFCEARVCAGEFSRAEVDGVLRCAASARWLESQAQAREARQAEFASDW